VSTVRTTWGPAIHPAVEQAHESRFTRPEEAPLVEDVEVLLCRGVVVQHPVKKLEWKLIANDHCVPVGAWRVKDDAAAPRSGKLSATHLQKHRRGHKPASFDRLPRARVRGVEQARVIAYQVVSVHDPNRTSQWSYPPCRVADRRRAPRDKPPERWIVGTQRRRLRERAEPGS
jgi:hypothetical protein